MGRPRIKLNQNQAKRLSELITREGLSQEALALTIGLSPQMVGRIVNGKAAITLATAQKIHDAYPEYRLEWILGTDAHRTESSVRDALYREAWAEVEKADAFEAVVRNLLSVSFLPCPMPEPDEGPALGDDEADLIDEQRRQAWRHDPRSCDVFRSGEVVGQCSLVERDAFLEGLQDIIIGTGERWLCKLIQKGDCE